MHRILLALACLVCAGHGRRVHMSGASQSEASQFRKANSAEELSKLLMALNPAAAAFSGVNPSTRFHPESKRIYATAPAKRARRAIMEEEEDELLFDFTNAAKVAQKEKIAKAMEKMSDQQKENELLRAKEKFVQKDTGSAVCKTCSYIYDQSKNNNIPFGQLPDTWACPRCKSPKAFFEITKETIAGFADNQESGFFNYWTASQKETLIFGGLALTALLLLAGYGLN